MLFSLVVKLVFPDYKQCKNEEWGLTVRNSVLVSWIQYGVHLVFIAMKLSSSTSFTPQPTTLLTPFHKPSHLGTTRQLGSRHYQNQVWNCISIPSCSSVEWGTLSVTLKRLSCKALLEQFNILVALLRFWNSLSWC